jgi:hypothetical protein
VQGRTAQQQHTYMLFLQVHPECFMNGAFGATTAADTEVG